MNQTQNSGKTPYYQEKPYGNQKSNVIYSSNIEPKDNTSKRNNQPTNYHKAQQRPLTASNPIFIPSRKHKYIKKE